MGIINVDLPLQIESLKPMKVILEPLAEYFFLEPNKNYVVHALFDGDTKHLNFTIGIKEDVLIIYSPGEIPGFVESYITCDGVRLDPLVE